MTCAELIEKLKTFPPGMTVMTYRPQENAYCSRVIITAETVVALGTHGWYMDRDVSVSKKQEEKIVGIE